jgi:outer membrane protein TolC
MRHVLLLFALTALPFQPIHAAPADLPEARIARAALDEHPLVRAAEARLRAAQAEQARLRAGPHEFAVRMGAAQRNVKGAPDQGEWETAIERGLRLPDKARLDERLGGTVVEEAVERVGEARHEAARQLIAQWYAVLQAQADARLWQEQAALLEQEARIVTRRVAAGDAARMQVLQVETARSQAAAQLAQAQTRAQAALAELTRHFPSLPVPTGQDQAPALPAGDEAAWIERTLARNHELHAARHAAARARLAAQRLAAERWPDPVLGLRYAREQGGDERVLGFSLAIALPGEARRAAVVQQSAEADAQAETEAGVARRLAAEAAANWQRASGAVAAYQSLADAARAAGRHAELTRRAFELGELGLSDVLLARRAALEARLALEQARLQANAAIATLLLDAHALWPADPLD